MCNGANRRTTSHHVKVRSGRVALPTPRNWEDFPPRGTGTLHNHNKQNWYMTF